MKLRMLFSLILVGCAGPKISAPNTTPCTPAGRLWAGMDCAEINTGKIHELSYQETIDFLEPQAARECVSKPPFAVCADDQSHGARVKLAARAGAIAESDDDFTSQKTAFEQACEELHDRCTPEMKAAFSGPALVVSTMLKKAQKKKSP